ncbi:Nif3-like dinuclear metal center hexameric protein [Streptococcus catagoni]|uniref:Nif3-like dinuclear metal center hexameric protein n=1 Tax=Streptococcus catagoni TaxID=2654874 RepID=UPI001408135E|nr:Nif3-like dinuclear metal center hexameric protein [Streptococcus catagoni]
MKVSEIIKVYEDYCPKSLSLEDDVVGLQIGSLEKEVKTLMIALDVREQTVEEAIAKGVDLIITKHAPIFKPLKDLVSSPQRDILLDLVKHDIAVYVSHTNIDIVPDGLNDWFCQKLGIEKTSYLKETQEGYGLGRIGEIKAQSLEDFSLLIKETFQLDAVRLIRYAGANPLIKRVAICGGSGDDFYKSALKKGADVYVTGDIYYHTAQEMLTEGLYAIDPGHHIEVLFVEKVYEKMLNWKKEGKWDIAIIASEQSTNPFSHL